MAKQSEIESMIGKAMLDAEFRKEVITAPESAAKKLGIELTPEQVMAFKAHDVATVAKQLEKIESKSCYFRAG